jgi:hypothetical protein
MAVNQKNMVNYIIAYEDGSLNQEKTLQLFSYLVKTGMVWRLQGFYGRMASSLINDGFLSPKGRINRKRLEEVM